jgi:flavin reductase (DIM6/NTAB) family NADH-FMN oxidoreductase RutF
MGHFATGVVVLSTEFDGQAHGMTVNAFMSGSLEPPLVIVSVGRAALMHARIRKAGMFGVSVLCEMQQTCSNHFAGKRSPMFAPLFDRLRGVPVLAGAAVRLAAELRHAYPCGDHTLFVGEVRELDVSREPKPPLLFHGGRYARLGAADRGSNKLPDGFWASAELAW